MIILSPVHLYLLCLWVVVTHPTVVGMPQDTSKYWASTSVMLVTSVLINGYAYNRYHFKLCGTPWWTSGEQYRGKFVDNLFFSMRQRCLSVINAYGRHTKYQQCIFKINTSNITDFLLIFALCFDTYNLNTRDRIIEWLESENLITAL